jgi:hypothetical protein
MYASGDVPPTERIKRWHQIHRAVHNEATAASLVMKNQPGRLNTALPTKHQVYELSKWLMHLGYTKSTVADLKTVLHDQGDIARLAITFPNTPIMPKGDTAPPEVAREPPMLEFQRALMIAFKDHLTCEGAVDNKGRAHAACIACGYVFQMRDPNDQPHRHRTGQGKGVERCMAMIVTGTTFDSD